MKNRRATDTSRVLTAPGMEAQLQSLTTAGGDVYCVPEVEQEEAALDVGVGEADGVVGADIEMAEEGAGEDSVAVLAGFDVEVFGIAGVGVFDGDGVLFGTVVEGDRGGAVPYFECTFIEIDNPKPAQGNVQTFAHRDDGAAGVFNEIAFEAHGDS
jgi:hypothetical protein